MSRRAGIYTSQVVAAHNSPANCWLSRHRRVYNISSFINDHPGGSDILAKYAGQDVTEVMSDGAGEHHEHCEAAYNMMEAYLIGNLDTNASISKNDSEVNGGLPKTNTSNLASGESEFLDLDKPLMKQVWEAKFSKSYYLEQVHKPRHVTGSARLFESSILEATWWVIPIFWGPITGYILIRSLIQFSIAPLSLPSVVSHPPLPLAVLPQAFTASNLLKTGACFIVGNIVWTVLEYGMHRFVFHLDDWLPDNPIAILIHFGIHGIHHYLPTDRLRLVMPPVLFGALQAPFTHFFHMILPAPVANGVIAGIMSFYILYDLMHYALHHHSRIPSYLRERKLYHLAHHYRNSQLGFGVTTKFWDRLLNTEHPL
ncbi:oxidoreductase [Mycena maculata]|uniref:Ceramide very long chain fatty acid hydroxylase n=1 Tax=Mycena maculata TaxID=230809 RepID=A0AAD7P263_9AGAR|nr:oxidoreductase [Mycena maculata]